MIDPLRELVVYVRLAQACKERLQMSDRDRALVLAGTCATIIEMRAIANFCRQLVLQNNQGHMLRKYDTFLGAVEDPDFGVFLKQVRRKLSAERAEAMLAELGHVCDVRPGDYENDESYVAAVMGVDVDWLTENFG